MAHYAEIDEAGMVLRVLTIDADTIQTGAFGDPSRWVQTSYNTYGGKHSAGGVPLRMNYAAIGGRYDVGLDAFIPPRPFASWTLDPATCLWVSPVPMPSDGGAYGWDEAQGAWVAL